MFPRQITHQNIFRVLIAGFSLVILLLLAAAFVGIRNIQSIRESAASLVREQSVTKRLIDELHSQQTSLSEVFSVLALAFAVVAVRMVWQLIRGMEWQPAELGRVSWHMLEDQEATARRFSHELHDELGQSLTAIKTNLTALDTAGPVQPARLEDSAR